LLQPLFSIPLELAGVPVFGFGLLLAVWAVASIALLAWLARRQGFTADTWTYVPLLVLVGTIIWWLLPVLCNDRGLPIRGYGMMLLLGVLSGTGRAMWRARRVGLKADVVLTLAFWLFVPGLIGARAFYVSEYWATQYWPVCQEKGLAALLGAVLNVAQGGLVIYGAFIGAVVGVLLFGRKYRVPLLATCDLMAPSLMLGLALGRVGCLLNGCCFGGVCTIHCPAIEFPWGSPVQVRQAERGQIFVHGLKVVGDADDPPVITEVQPGSPAEQHGLAAGERIDEINGVSVEKLSDAQAALLSAHKLHIEIKPVQGRAVEWILDPPPAPAQPAYQLRAGQTWIDGAEIVGEEHDPPVIAQVERGSWADFSERKPHERIISVNGRAAKTIGKLRSLLAAEHSAPWIRVKTAGAPSAVEWALERPLPPGLPVYPTQIYDSLSALLLCLLLLAYDPFRRRDGELFALMMSVYPVTRFLLERIRTDEAKAYYAGMTISQTMSLVFLACAAGLWYYLLHRPRGTARGMRAWGLEHG